MENNNENKIKQSLEDLLRWVEALAIVGSVTPEAWELLNKITNKAHAALNGANQAADEIERLREALNIFMAIDPDKSSSWLYKREKAEALVKEILSTCNQSLQVQKWICPLNRPDCHENCGDYGCGN